MDDTGFVGCHKVGPSALSGDVDENGEIVDALIARLAGGVGPVVGFDALEHVERVRAVVTRERPVLGVGSWVRS